MEEGSTKVGIYIDLSNVEKTLRELNGIGLFLDYSRTIEILSKGKELVVLRAYDCYVDTSCRLTELQQNLGNAGVEMVLSRLGTSTDEVNSKKLTCQKEVDTGITTDASWDLALGKVDEAIIISGDRDMYPAYRRAKAEGRKLTIVSVRNGLSQKYAEQLDDYMLLEDLDVFTVCGEESEMEENVVTHRVVEEAAADVQ